VHCQPLEYSSITIEQERVTALKHVSQIDALASSNTYCCKQDDDYRGGCMPTKQQTQDPAFVASLRYCLSILVLTSGIGYKCHVGLTSLWGFLLQCLQLEQRLYHLLVHLQRHSH